MSRKTSAINLIHKNYLKTDSLEWSRSIQNRVRIIWNGGRVRKARAAKTVNRSLNSMARERPRDNEKCYCNVSGICAIHESSYLTRNDIYGKTYMCVCVCIEHELVRVNQQYIIRDEVLQPLCVNRISLLMQNKNRDRSLIKRNWVYILFK